MAMEVETENYPQICLISNDDLKHEFDEMSIVVTDDSVLSYAKRLCILYDIDATELVNRWLSFTSHASLVDQTPTVALLERFEREYVHRKSVSIQTEILDRDKKKLQIDTRPTDISILRDYGNVTALSETSHELEITSNDNGDLMELNMENEFVLKKHIIQYYGESLHTSKWVNIHGNTHKVSPFNPNLYLDKPYKYMKLNLHFCSEVMDQFTEHLIKPLKEGLNIESFEDFNVESSVERYYVGKVRVEASDGKLNEAVLLEMSQNSRRRARVDLSELSEYSLFPGQVIAVKSTYDFNSGLKPSEIADVNLTINPFSTKTIKLNNPLYIVYAAGPYNSSNEVNDTLLQKLFDYVKEAKPQFVVLTGPFVDSENSVIKESHNPFDLFNDVMNTINYQLQNSDTTAIVVPSPRDLHHNCIYPTPAFQRESDNKWPNIYFAPNPCLLDISGIVIAINSADVLMHMIRNEIARVAEPEANSRLLRLCKHLLSQQSFYPLSPADPQINVQYTKLEYLHLPVTPHLFLLSSQLKSFAKQSKGCVFVNNESLSKGVISRIRIGPPSEVQGTLNKYIDVEIVKL